MAHVTKRTVLVSAGISDVAVDVVKAFRVGPERGKVVGRNGWPFVLKCQYSAALRPRLLRRVAGADSDGTLEGLVGVADGLTEVDVREALAKRGPVDVGRSGAGHGVSLVWVSSTTPMRPRTNRQMSVAALDRCLDIYGLGENKTNCVEDLPRSRRLCAEAPFAERPFEARCGLTAVLHHISVDEQSDDRASGGRDARAWLRGDVVWSGRRIAPSARHSSLMRQCRQRTPRTRRDDRSGYSTFAGPWTAIEDGDAGAIATALRITRRMGWTLTSDTLIEALIATRSRTIREATHCKLGWTEESEVTLIPAGSVDDRSWR